MKRGITLNVSHIVFYKCMEREKEGTAISKNLL